MSFYGGGGRTWVPPVYETVKPKVKSPDDSQTIFSKIFGMSRIKPYYHRNNPVNFLYINRNFFGLY
jgi:hypothetical protein